MANKVKDIGKGGSLRKYIGITHGDVALWRAVRNELLTMAFGYIPGALGLALRRIFFPCIFRRDGLNQRRAARL